MDDRHPHWPHTGHLYPVWTWQTSDRMHTRMRDRLHQMRKNKRWAEQHDNAAAARGYDHIIHIYEQIAAELHQRDAAARDQYARDHEQWDDRNTYTRARNSVWADVLRWARSGELPADWRIHLPGYHARCIAITDRQPREDIDGLVLHEFATLPTQPWEPHAAADWRTALDAWYHDSLALHHRSYHQRTELRDSKPRPFNLPVPLPPDTHAGGLDYTDLDAQQALRQADSRAVDEVNYDRGRDRLEAWYRAGLTAGGTGEDWIGWYRDRITTWDSRHDAYYCPGLIRSDHEMARCDDGDAATLDPSAATAGGWIRIPMQQLPAYWRHRE